MKKVLAVLMMVLMCTTAAMADDLKVKSGSFKPFKSGGKMTVVFDLSQAKYDNKKELTSEYRGLGNLMQDISSEFVREFNEESKNVTLSLSGKGDYKMVVKITNVDRHYNPMSWKPGITTKLEGFVTITDANGDEVANVEIDEVGNEGIGNENSLEEAFEELAEQLAKRCNKAK